MIHVPMSVLDAEKAPSISTESNSQIEKSKEYDVSVHDHCSDPRESNEDAIAPEPHLSVLEPTFSNRAASTKTTETNRDPDFEVDWDDGDPMNPRNWPIWYKGCTISFVSWSTWCVVVYSTSYTSGISQMGEEFHVSSEPVVTLGVTTYCK